MPLDVAVVPEPGQGSPAASHRLMAALEANEVTVTQVLLRRLSAVTPAFQQGRIGSRRPSASEDGNDDLHCRIEGQQKNTQPPIIAMTSRYEDRGE